MDVPINDAMVKRIVMLITEKHGNACRDSALEGVMCTASGWRAEDGDEAAFSAFCVRHFMTGEDRDALFSRLAGLFEKLYGSMLAISVRLKWASHVDNGPLLPVDDIMSSWAPDAHVTDDLYGNRLAFVIRLNFPYKQLDLKLRDGPAWTRRQWAEARLGDCLVDRIPADAAQRLESAFADAAAYVSAYNIYPAGLAGTEQPGDTLFPPDKRLLMHWNMRDEIKAQYADPAGLVRQRLLYQAMERVVDGGIPLVAIDNAATTWNPAAQADSAAEGDGRYQHLLDIFRAQRLLDPWCPFNATLMARRFNADREIPEKDVERLFHELLSSHAFPACANLVRQRLGRNLEPFDVWYRAFDEGSKPAEATLDSLTRARYPDARAFKADIPRILSSLGFDADESRWLAGYIDVDQARGSGHAMPAAMREDKVRLRTRVPATGMDYKGFNIACHELGHNVEQVYSLQGIDEYFLAGVPNTAFTEAFAFLFQARDLSILGAQTGVDRPAVLADFWATCEIAGVALVDMELWRWLYAHPECDATALRKATMDIARSVWNRFFAAAFGVKDALVLAVYSHMIDSALYLPDYPLGHIIAFQIEAAMDGSSVGSQMGRMCRLGRLTPEQWMRQAVGAGISAEPLLKAATAALGGSIKR